MRALVGVTDVCEHEFASDGMCVEMGFEMKRVLDCGTLDRLWDKCALKTSDTTASLEQISGVDYAGKLMNHI